MRKWELSGWHGKFVKIIYLFIVWVHISHWNLVLIFLHCNSLKYFVCLLDLSPIIWKSYHTFLYAFQLCCFKIFWYIFVCFSISLLKQHRKIQAIWHCFYFFWDNNKLKTLIISPYLLKRGVTWNHPENTWNHLTLTIL